MRTFRLCIALLTSVLMAASGSAGAHTVGVSRGEYRPEGSSLRAELTFARPELASAVAGLDIDGDGRLSAQEVASGHELIGAAVLSGLEVKAAPGPCRGELESVSLVSNDGVIVGLRYRCAGSPSTFQLRLPLLASLSQGHRHLVTVRSAAAASPVSQVVYEADPLFEVTAAPTASGDAGVAGPLFALGIEHILAGADHLIFLLGVILVGGRFRALVLAVTAFTLAHSITLALATLDYWVPSPDLVEPLIALSIVYVGIENWFVKDGSRRWLLTFPFGLIHGFGFAGALQEVALPAAQLPLALLSFNLGVETGQLLALVLVFPFVLWLQRQSWFASHGMRATSTLIAVAGLAWFVQRVV